jgi:hypothetical protein
MWDRRRRLVAATMTAGIGGVGVGITVCVNYRVRSRQYEADRRLFESLLKRYRTASTYTQLKLRGLDFFSWPSDTNATPGCRSAKTDVLLDAHLAMSQSYKAQPGWVKSYQRLRKCAPPTAAECDLDESWLHDAKRRLYTPLSPPTGEQDAATAQHANRAQSPLKQGPTSDLNSNLTAKPRYVPNEGFF